MMRVLFVDDEQSVLDGLQNLLRRQRNVWEMVFVTSAAEALVAMEAAAFDVVVSDMRMPVTDGAQLLELVKRSRPMTVRIILSGQADLESVMRALPVTHQFLSKPCDPIQLQSAIDRVGMLQALLYDESIRTMVVSIDHLPSVPASYWELTKAIADEDCDIAAVARIVERDSAMSLKVLQLVRSAYFGRPREHCTVEQAVSFLGLEVMRGISLSSQVFMQAGAAVNALVPLAELQEHALRTAALCRKFASGRAVAEEAFIAGLLHDVGRLVLAQGLPDRYAGVVSAVRDGTRPLHEVEREVLGVSHAEVGAHLLGTWGLALPIVEAVAFHHRPAGWPGQNEVLAILHVAAILAASPSPEGGEDSGAGTIDRDYLERAGFAPRLEEWTRLAEASGASQSHAA